MSQGPETGHQPSSTTPDAGGSRAFSWLLILGLLAAVLSAAASDDMERLLLIAAPLAVLLSWWRSGISSLGFRRPPSWLKLIAWGLVAGVGLQAVSLLLIEPLVYALTGEAADTTAFAAVEGNAAAAGFMLLLIWTVVAFGEEIVFRGFLICQLEKVLGGSSWALAANVLASSALFGAGHLYQGIAGVLVTTAMGALMAILFLTAGRNLWLVIFIHGVVDTVAVGALYFGVYDNLETWSRAWWM